MQERAYINQDGSVKADIIAEQQASLAMSAQRHNVDPQLVDALMAEVNKHGFVIIPNLVSREMMDGIKTEIMPLLTYDGRNEFEGHKTRRIYSVIEKTLALNPLLEHPLIMALLDRVLLPNYLLSQLQAINILPGEVAQPLHCDDGFYPIPRPRKPFSAATIWAIDDFTADNGATVAIPDSHLWGDEHPDDGSSFTLVPAVMPAGSVLFFLGTLWHGGGASAGRRYLDAGQQQQRRSHGGHCTILRTVGAPAGKLQPRHLSSASETLQ